MKRKYLFVLVSIMMIFLACCGKEEEKQIDISSFQINVYKEVNPQLKVNINKEFDKSQVKNQTMLKVDTYPLSQEWAQYLADKYFNVEGNKELKRNMAYEESFGDLCYDVLGENYYFIAKPDSVTFFTDKKFDEQSRIYFEDYYGQYPYFKATAAEYYDKSDLEDMSYQAAKDLCVEVLDELNFPYHERAVEGYTITAEGMEKYKADNPVLFQTNENITFAEKGFYVFCFPISVAGGSIRGNGKFIEYAQFMIEGSHIVSAFIPARLEIEREEREPIKSPEYVLDKIITMYENTILTQNVEVYDLNMIYTCTKMNLSSEKGCEALEYICAPAWEFNVRFSDESGTMEGTVLYNAITGERI